VVHLRPGSTKWYQKLPHIWWCEEVPAREVPYSMPKFSCCFMPGNVVSLGRFPCTVFLQWEVLKPWPRHMSAFKMLGECPHFFMTLYDCCIVLVFAKCKVWTSISHKWFLNVHGTAFGCVLRDLNISMLMGPHHSVKGALTYLYVETLFHGPNFNKTHNWKILLTMAFTNCKTCSRFFPFFSCGT